MTYKKLLPLALLLLSGAAAAQVSGPTTKTPRLTVGPGPLVVNGTLDCSGGDCSSVGGLPETPLSVPNGGTSVSTVAEDQILIGDTGGDAFFVTIIPPCLDSSGNHLNYDNTSGDLICGTSSSASGGTTFYSASLAADDVVTTTTMADKLSASSLPAGNYAFEAWFRITQTDGGADLKLAVYSGVTPASNNFENRFTCSDTTALVHAGSPFQSGGTSPAVTAFDYSGGSQCVFIVTGSIELGSSADVRLQWAQSVATGTTTISRGSWMRLMKVN